MKIGILALQGAFIEHCQAIERLGGEAVAVRLPGQLHGLDGLIIPGGESTTMSRLMVEYELIQPLKDLAREGLPILGTCAGMILMAKSVPEFTLQTLGLMDITVRRNAFGSQVDSFEADLEMPVLGQPSFHAVFIRAPIIEAADSTVEVLARLPDGAAVAARQGKLLAVAFHPELTPDARFHRFFVDTVRSR
ncbi:MAG TPA: pyridoxal 5'-phosphate synthase glutaminase subunit PdxT [Dehalococcoidia bacterium]|nr:pyridoxal 5'-phosphate synthase glutaminase subunit PdxT [Dehalococcoidia bacterium]